MKLIENGLKRIGVLVVDEYYGKFVEVDGRLWNKDVASFVGEKYSQPCDQRKSHKTQCRKHTGICVRCHYSKQPCTVGGKKVLNPIHHYRPKGSKGINNFEDTLNAMMEGNAAIASIAQQSLAGLDITAHFEAIRVHISRLRECLNSAEEVDEGGKDSEDDSADNGAEGVAGPSMK